MEKSPKYQKLEQLFLKDYKERANIKEVLPHLPEYIIDINQTGDIYYDFSFFCAIFIIEDIKSLDSSYITTLNIFRRALQAVVNWGIFPHLPKSIQFSFNSNTHWIDSPAPPRLLRPAPETLNALELAIKSPDFSLLTPTFLPHLVATFHYLEPTRLSEITAKLNTGSLLTVYLALLPKKL